MRPESELISKLVAKLIGTIGSSITTNTTKGSVPPVIKKKIKSYNKGFSSPIWTHADDDILALIALADLMWDKKISLMARKDETSLQNMFGVNAVSEQATSDALYKMNLAGKDIKMLKKQCEVMPTIANTVVAKAIILGIANISQISFDKMGANEVKMRCDKNIKTINKILKMFDTVIPINERILLFHTTH